MNRQIKSRISKEEIREFKLFMNSDEVQHALEILPKHKRISFLIKAYEDVSGIKMCYGTVKKALTSNDIVVKVGDHEYRY